MEKLKINRNSGSEIYFFIQGVKNISRTQFEWKLCNLKLGKYRKISENRRESKIRKSFLMVEKKHFSLTFNQVPVARMQKSVCSD